VTQFKLDIIKLHCNKTHFKLEYEIHTKFRHVAVNNVNMFLLFLQSVNSTLSDVTFTHVLTYSIKTQNTVHCSHLSFST